MNLETIQMAQKADHSPKPEKSQAELRAALEQKLNSLKFPMREGMKEYEQALKDGLFEEQDNEPAGTGEARKEAMQKKLTALFDRAEKMKAKLISQEPLPQSLPEIATTYTHPDNTQETITLDLEAKLEDFLAFYQKTNLDLPPDFADTIRDIWDRHQADIEQAMEEKGFNEMLIIPGNIPLQELSEKMKMENGCYFYQVKDDFSDVVSQNTVQSRIILVHNIESLPEIAEKTGLDIHLNITGADAQKLYKQNPDQYLSTLEDAIILERKHYEETGQHLSDYTKKSAQWLPGSKAGARLINSYWDPGHRKLHVLALDLEYQHDRLGVRPSRCFF